MRSVLRKLFFIAYSSLLCCSSFVSASVAMRFVPELIKTGLREDYPYGQGRFKSQIEKDLYNASYFVNDALHNFLKQQYFKNGQFAIPDVDDNCITTLHSIMQGKVIPCLEGLLAEYGAKSMRETAVDYDGCGDSCVLRTMAEIIDRFIMACMDLVAVRINADLAPFSKDFAEKCIELNHEDKKVEIDFCDFEDINPDSSWDDLEGIFAYAEHARERKLISLDNRCRSFDSFAGNSIDVFDIIDRILRLFNTIDMQNAMNKLNKQNHDKWGQMFDHYNNIISNKNTIDCFYTILEIVKKMTKNAGLNGF